MLQSKKGLILLVVSACSEWMATSTKNRDFAPTFKKREEKMK